MPRLGWRGEHVTLRLSHSRWRLLPEPVRPRFRGQREAVRQAQMAEVNAKQAHIAELCVDARNEALRSQSLSFPSKPSRQLRPAILKLEFCWLLRPCRRTGCSGSTLPT